MLKRPVFDAAFFGTLAATLALVQAVPYLYSIVRGNTRPSRASYAIWSGLEVISLAGYISAGATHTVWAPIVIAINVLIVFGLSFHYGVGGYARSDIFCIAIAIVAVTAWTLTDNPDLAVYAGSLAGSVGYIPTLKKLWRDPHLEHALSWGIYALACFCNLFAVTDPRAVIWIPIVASLVGGTVTTALILRPRWDCRFHEKHPAEEPTDDRTTPHN
jgi:hypothetical protein